MTDLTADPTAADLPEPEPAPRPVVPPGDDETREAWFREHIRAEFARAGRTLTPVELDAGVGLNKLDLFYPGEFVVYMDTWLDDEVGGWLVRREVLFHSADWEALQEFHRTRPDLDRQRIHSTYVDEPGVVTGGLGLHQA